MQSSLEISNLHFQWPDRHAFSISVPALEVMCGETVLLLGESGSGKSTLLSLICGIMLPDHGSVRVDGTDITRLSMAQRDRFRAEKTGVIFQQFNLLPFGSVLDNILLPLRFAPARRKRVKDSHAQAGNLCNALGLPKDMMVKASALSVGQQQRVAVARALIGQPPIIIADEPTSALDVVSQSNFMSLLFEQVQAQGTTLVMVSHDARHGRHFDRVLHLEDIAHIERRAA